MMINEERNYRRKRTCWAPTSALFFIGLCSFLNSTEARFTRSNSDRCAKHVGREIFCTGTSPFILDHVVMRGGSQNPFYTGGQRQSSNAGPWRSPINARPEGSTKQATKVTFLGYDEHEPITEEDEKTKEMINAFLTRDSRKSFITRVYAVLTGQLLVTALSVVGLSKNRQLAYWFLTKGKLAFYLAMMLSVWSCVKMSTDPSARRKSPQKWNLLGIFTASEAFTVGLVCSLFAAKTLMSAFLATSTATGGITLYTLLQNNPKYDLSQWGSGISSLILVSSFFGVLRLLFGDGFLPLNQMIYSGIGAVLFSIYLAHHTRLIVAGKHSKYQMNEKDYVYGAMTLYLDIINIFLRMVQIFDQMEREKEK